MVDPTGPTPTAETIQFLKDTVASMMPVPKFSIAANITELTKLVP